MSFKSHLCRLTRTHALAYQRILQALEPMPNPQYFADQGLFFQSIHGTLNHMYLVDMLWIYRLKQERPPIQVDSLDQQIFDNRDELATGLVQQAEAFHQWVEEQSDEFFDMEMRVKTLSLGEIFHKAGWLVATMVNHGTHHRGQITAVLTQKDYEFPPLDLPFYD